MPEFEITPGIREHEYHQAYASSYDNSKDTSFYQQDNLKTFSDYVMPKDRKKKIEKSKEYRNVDIIDRVLRIRQDFGRKPKRIVCNSSRQKKFYDENVLPLLKEYYPKWVYEYHSLGDVFSHFGFDANDKYPMYIITEDPTNIDVVSALGAEYYKVRISGEFKKQIEKLRAEGQLDQLPAHLAKLFKDNKQVVGNTLTITRENMYRTTNLKPDYALYSEPPLMKIAEALELRRLLTANDFANATQKSEIIHTRVGNKDEKGSKADSRIRAIHDIISKQPPGSFYFTTAYDVDVSRVGPDPQMYSADKFKEANSRILQWAGITVTLLSGEASAYGSAVASFKGLQASIDSDCQTFDQFVSHYFKEINRRWGFKDDVKVEYEDNKLVDEKDRQAVVKYLVGMGVLSFEDLCNIYDLDYKEQLKKKKWDKDNVVDVAAPWFEEKQGLLSDEPAGGSGGNEPGRPGDPVRNTNQPRPS